MAATNLTCSNDVQFLCGTELQMANEVFLAVAIFFVDTLSVHDCSLVEELAVVGFT